MAPSESGGRGLNRIQDQRILAGIKPVYTSILQVRLFLQCISRLATATCPEYFLWFLCFADFDQPLARL
mgnify:CR=1 FL=1